MISHRYIEVLVSPCQKKQEGWTLCGDRIHESRHTEWTEALKCANFFRGPNLSVVIRLSFNETVLDDGGRVSFREWRSFHNEEFTEIRFYLDDRTSDSHKKTDVEMTQVVISTA